MLVSLAALGPATAHASDPLPGDANHWCPLMPQREALPRFSAEHEGRTIYFCCGRCVQQFQRDPAPALARLATWAEQGAPPADGDANVSAGDLPGRAGPGRAGQPIEATEASGARTASPGWRAWVGRLHPLAVHFPIALLLAAAVAEMLYLVDRSQRFADAGRFCLWLGAAGGLLAGALGWLAAGGAVMHDTPLLAVHRWAGTTLVALALLLVVLLELAQHRPASRWRLGYRAGLLIAVALVGLTGHLGGAIVRGSDYLALPW